MRNTLKFFAIVTLAILFASCEKETISQSDAGTKSKPKPGAPIHYVKFSESILPVLKDPNKCFGCHDGGTPDFGPDRNTVYTTLLTGKDAASKKLVDTTNATLSVLYTKILPGDHNSMPASFADTCLIWIQQGAKNN